MAWGAGLEMAKKTKQHGDAERERIAGEAADWLVKVIDNKMLPPERAAFEAWLGDERHRETFTNLQRLWRGSSELPAIKARAPKPRRLTRRDLGKAALVLAAGGAGWSYLSDYPFADHRTGTGERKTFNTPDGTRIDLAARSRLSANFTDSDRRVTLHEGEAFFSVAKDARPFSVEAGGGVTTALGTSFGVRLRGPQARVIVVEHAIRVSLGGSAVNVDSGYEVEYGATLGPVEQGDAGEELSWREGRLVFNGTPLSEVVQALNLWRRGRIVVLDRDLAQRPVTFIADVNRLDSIDQEIERSMRVRALQVTPLLILLFPRN